MDSNGLGKLLPKGIAAKRRRKKESKEDMSASPAAASDVSTNGSSFDNDRNLDSTPRSVAKNGANDVKMADEEDPSFASYESEGESPGRHPSLSSHPSQIGYLTTSSPLVQAVHQPESQSPDSDRASKSSTFPSQVSDSGESEFRASRAQTALLPPKNAAKRSPSPAGRIKGIFRSKKSSSSLGRSPSPEKPSSSDVDRESDRPPTSSDTPPVPPVPKLDPPAHDSDTANSSSSGRRSRGQTKIDTSVPPKTPPASDSPAPVIVNTPPTPTDPGFHVLTKPPPARQAPDTGSQLNTSDSAPTHNFVAGHRRLRSGSAGPSKLSNITLPPLTPTPENGILPSTPSSSFFSSVLSAAQNAANTLTTSIQNTNIGQNTKVNKAASSTKEGQLVTPEDSVEVDTIAAEMPQEQALDKKELAVRTLGAGDLSLSQLGLSDPLPAPAMSKIAETEGRARSESVPTEPSAPLSQADVVLDDLHASHRPRSMYDSPGTGDRTPPTASVNEGSGLQRSGSIRSAIGRRATRKRGSSVATGQTGTTGTGTTIGAAITAAHASVAHPRANQSTPKLTGFAIASKKRNRDFHVLFKSVPDDDYLIEDYSCALQREILAHGRLYVSEGHLCFSSNIIGWVTTLVMSFDEIVSVEKRSTALIFKNGLMISTLQNKHIFASFTNRDSTYDLIVKIWQLGHPSLKSSLNGVRQEGIGGDKTERIVDEPAALPLAGDETASESETDDEDIYDEDDEDGHVQEATQATDVSGQETEGEKAVARKASGMVGTNGEVVQAKESPTQGLTGPPDFPGPLSHAATDCGDAATHYDKIVGDDIIPAPIGKVFSMLFGTQSVTWIPKFLTGDQKCTELQMEDKKGLSNENKSRTYSYIRPLSGGIGPKQTRCIISENVDNIDWEKAVNMNVTTQNPDVPSGNVFCVKTKYCLSWAEKDCTRVQVNCTVEWSGKSWLKGPIENGARDGQTAYCKDLFAAMKASLPARPGVGTTGQKAKKRSRKARQQQSADITDTEVLKPTVKKDWGLLEPVRPFAEPIVDVVRPILTGNVVYGLLVGLLVASWFGFGSDKSKSVVTPRDAARMYDYPERIALYEEMWRREESELWEWLEERVSMERLASDPERRVKRAVEPRVVEERVAGQGMDDREVDEAIRVTEEKLKVLKEVVGKKKHQKGSEGGGGAV